MCLAMLTGHFMSMFSLASGIVTVTAPAHYFPDQAYRLSKEDHRIVTNSMQLCRCVHHTVSQMHAHAAIALFGLLHGFRGHNVVTHCLVQASPRPVTSAVIHITLRMIRISGVLEISLIES